MATCKVNFEDIRIIFCVQGYSLDYKFVLREIGFWTKGFSGSVPFNCKINKNQLDIQSKRTIEYLEDDIHGIKFKKHIENGLASSESKAVLRTLYHMNSNEKAKKIGICRDENINGLLHYAGLGSQIINLDDLFMFQNSNDNCPSNNELKLFMKTNSNKYSICEIHDQLRNNDLPICAKVKAEFIADYCQSYQKNLTVAMKSLTK